MKLPQFSYEDIKRMIEIADKVKSTAGEIYDFLTEIAERSK